MIKAIIFDYDGVIKNSFPHQQEIYGLIGDACDFYVPEDYQEFRAWYGDRHYEEILTKTAGLDDAGIKVAEGIFRREIAKGKPLIHSGIKEVIEELSHNHQMILVSANYTHELWEKTVKWGIVGCFDHIKGVDSSDTRKPKNEMFQDIFDAWKLRPEQVVSIGDRAMDYLDGKAAGIDNFILASYGWPCNLEKIPANTPIAHSPEEIPAAIETIVNGR
ncbi:HAD family hydrolase [Candidatus Woesearchaeota archaeon]|nr:HAD family hydrolase [Candidatus Woesearchaeota archaeon]